MWKVDQARERPLPELLTTRELADSLGVPVSTVRFWRGRGEGPPGFKLGKRVVYRTTDVARWLDQQRKSA
jgi:DNA-binding transcriptional MerR regulator